MSRPDCRTASTRKGEHVTEVPDEAWESDDCVRRTVVMPGGLAERLAARAEQRGLSVSDLLAEYAEAGLQRDREHALPVRGAEAQRGPGVVDGDLADGLHPATRQ